MILAIFNIITKIFFRFLGIITYYCSKKRSPIALKNLDLCFGNKINEDSNNRSKTNKKILMQSYISLADGLSNFIFLRFYKSDNIDKYINPKNLIYLEQAIAKGKGVILSTAHFGSWELAAHYLALKGFKSLILYNPIKKPIWLEQIVKKNREISGNILLPKQNSFLSLFRHLRHGGIVTFLADQHCVPTDGLKIPFFGYNVWTHTGFIKLSLKTGAPIISGFIFTKNVFKYDLEIYKPLDPADFYQFKDAEWQMAAANNRILEAAVRKSPGHWMWQHRRFKDL